MSETVFFIREKIYKLENLCHIVPRVETNVTGHEKIRWLSGFFCRIGFDLFEPFELGLELRHELFAMVFIGCSE